MIPKQSITEIFEMSNGKKLDRRRVTLKKGALVQKGNQKYRISDIVSFQKAVGTNLDNNRTKLLNIDDLMPIDDPKLEKKLSKDDSEVSDQQWQIAQKRFEIISPIFNLCSG